MCSRHSVQTECIHNATIKRLGSDTMMDTTINSSKAHLLTSTVLAFLGVYASTLLFAPVASALEFQCEVQGDIRYLRVDIPGEEHLCEVSVKYEYTGERRVMWRAENDTTFCSARAYELRDKYESKWNFKCTTWPDRDGVDQLSANQRAILDKQLISLIEQGKKSTPTFKVNAVKAVASTPLDAEAGTIALQFFLSTGDLTQIIIDETSSWEVFATFNDLVTHVNSDSPLSAALIESISDRGALSISTTVSNGSELNCYGNQLMMVEPGNRLTPRTAHRFVCEPSPLVSKDER